MNLDGIVVPLLIFVASAYIFYIYYADARIGRSNGFPGASFASSKLIKLSIFLGVFLVITQSVSEISLGISNEQSTVKWFAVLGWMGAAIIEEIVFRGYLVVTKKGKFLLTASILLFSILFAIAHPFFWDYSNDTGMTFSFNLKAWLSTSFVFGNSVIFYILRFIPQNKTQSILPCMVAHLTFNVGVYIIKLFQGFVSF